MSHCYFYQYLSYHIWKVSLILIFTIFSLSASHAQGDDNPYIVSINKIGSNEKIKDKLIPNSLAQDKRNYVWFNNMQNTYRFDGEFLENASKSFEDTNIHNIIYLVRSRNGNMVTLNTDGIYKLDNTRSTINLIKKFPFLRSKDDIKKIWHNDDFVALETHDGYIKTLGIRYNSEGKIIPYISQEKISENDLIDRVFVNQYWKCIVHPHGKLEIFYVDDKQKLNLLFNRSISSGDFKVLEILDLKDDMITIQAAHRGKQYIINGKVEQGAFRAISAEPIQDVAIHSYIEMDNNIAIIITKDFKVKVYNGSSPNLYDISQKVLNSLGNYTEILYKGKTSDGSLWFWINDGWMVLNLKPNNFHTLLTQVVKNTYSTGVSIRAILPVTDSEILFSSYGLIDNKKKNLHSFNTKTGKLHHFQPRYKNYDLSFYQIKKNDKGDILLLSELGLILKLNLQSEQLELVSDLLTNVSMLKAYDFLPVPEGYLIATSNGLYLHDVASNKLIQYPWSDGVRVNHIDDDIEGYYLLSTKNGLIFINGKGEVQKTVNPNFQDSLDPYGFLVYHSLVLDGNIWLSTTNGLYQYTMNTGKLKRYGITEGLVNENVYTAISTGDSSLWLSTDAGISRFDIPTSSVINYGINDGLPTKEFNNNAYASINGELLVFGSVNGLVYFYPKDINREKRKYENIYRNTIQYIHNNIDNSIINYSAEKKSIVHLPAGSSSIQIDYIVPEYLDRSRIRLKYRFKKGESLDTNWTIIPANFLDFNYLPSGTHHLEVFFSVDNKNWSLNSDKLTIIVAPYWYNTWWFYLSVISGLGLITFLIIKMKLNQINKVLKIRNKISADVHDEIGSTLSSISLFAHSLYLQSRDDKQKAVLEKIKDYAFQIQENISDIIWSVKPDADKIEDLITRIRKYGSDAAESKGFQFFADDKSSAKGTSLDMIKRKNIYMILKEAINNAVKYSQAETIELLIESNHQQGLSFKVKDNGIGFSQESIKYGNGLKNMKRRAAEIGGTLEINTNVAKGCEIILYIK